MIELIETVFGMDWHAAALIVLNLILIESLLSVDNAAVLATMVLDLPPKERKRALKYGILGAYIFRGFCLVFASWLIKIWWLKPLGGAYLLYLFLDYFFKKPRGEAAESETVSPKESKWIYRKSVGKIGLFWSTVIAVEVMDLAFSIDNVFAAVAFTDNLWLICIGVFIGILAMRFVAQGFVKLIEKFPFLETAAFAVIGILGLKLVLSLWAHFDPHSAFAHWLETEQADIAVSVLTVACFGFPIASSLVLGWPKANKP